MSTKNTKFAIIIGINYINSDNPLNGCINDAENVRDYLIQRCNYSSENIRLLTDNPENELQPTGKNIFSAIKDMIDKANNENCNELWFSYSGHGSFTKDINGDEKDKRDEYILPSDAYTKGYISDDLLYKYFIKKLPVECDITLLIDCCYSGSMFDLPYIYRNDKLELNTNRVDTMLPNIVKISGSTDLQTSADLYIKEANGLLTFTFLKILNDSNYNISYINLINNMQQYIADNGHEQKPMLSLSKKIDLNNFYINNKNSKNNIKINMTGDKYAKTETIWNIYNSDTKSYIYAKNREFYFTNEKSSIYLTLTPGNYSLHFLDKYGDGGVQCNIINILNGKEIASSNFNKGKKYETKFIVENIEEKKEEVDVVVHIKGDYYASYKKESSWNIVNSDGEKIFEKNIYFSTHNEEQKVKIPLNRGEYSLEMHDKYGDGGMKGYIKANSEITNFNFKDGLFMNFKFIV